MERAILATDVAMYSKNNEQLKKLLTAGSYDVTKSNHRYCLHNVHLSTNYGIMILFY